MTTQWFSYSMYINPIGPDRRQIMRKCYSFFRAHTDTFIIWNLDKIIYFVLMQHNYDHDWLLFISPNLVFLYNLLQRTTNLPIWKKNPPNKSWNAQKTKVCVLITIIVWLTEHYSKTVSKQILQLIVICVFFLLLILSIQGQKRPDITFFNTFAVLLI